MKNLKANVSVIDKTKDVVILLSTYNGKSYLEEFLISLIQQNFTYWKLLIRDDGSTDGTIKIIKDFTKKDNRIQLINDSKKSLGPKKSFFRLAQIALKMVGMDFFMFADQDDIWLPDKIELTLNKMNMMSNSKVPCLVYTNLTLVDQDLKLIQKKMYGDTEYDCWKYLFLVNSVTGCTVMVNRVLLEMSLPTEEKQRDIVMHDWWFALVATMFGEIGYIKDPLILYRQHQGNSVGATVNILDKLHRIIDLGSDIKKIRQATLQIKVFNLFFIELIPSDISRNLEAFVEKQGKPFSLKRMIYIRNIKLRKRSLFGNIRLFLILLSSK